MRHLLAVLIIAAGIACTTTSTGPQEPRNGAAITPTVIMQPMAHQFIKDAGRALAALCDAYDLGYPTLIINLDTPIMGEYEEWQDGIPDWYIRGTYSYTDRVLTIWTHELYRDTPYEQMMHTLLHEFLHYLDHMEGASYPLDHNEIFNQRILDMGLRHIVAEALG